MSSVPTNKFQILKKRSQVQEREHSAGFLYEKDCIIEEVYDRDYIKNAGSLSDEFLRSYVKDESSIYCLIRILQTNRIIIGKLDASPEEYYTLLGYIKGRRGKARDIDGSISLVRLDRSKDEFLSELEVKLTSFDIGGVI